MIDFVEDIKDNVQNLTKTKKGKTALVIGGVGVVGLVFLMTRGDQSKLVNADEIVGYPSVGENSETILGAINDLKDNLYNTGIKDTIDNADKVGGSSGAGGGLTVVDKGNIKDLEYTFGGSPNTTVNKASAQKNLSVTVRDVTGVSKRDTSTLAGALQEFYDQQTGGGISYTVTDENGKKKNYYRPNRKQGNDSNGDGKVSVSYDKSGKLTSSELNEIKSVHSYDGKVYVDTIGSDGKKKNTTVYNSVKDLPTYTGSDRKTTSGSKSGQSVTVTR